MKNGPENEDRATVSSCRDVLQDKYRLSMLSCPLKHISDGTTSSRGGVVELLLTILVLRTFGLLTELEIPQPSFMDVVVVAVLVATETPP